MAKYSDRKLPVGIQSFDEIRKGGYVYIDKTDIIWRFVFITGITKFIQISLFSVLTNLSNISFEPEYAAICGITKDEVTGKRLNDSVNTAL